MGKTIMGGAMAANVIGRRVFDMVFDVRH